MEQLFPTFVVNAVVGVWWNMCAASNCFCFVPWKSNEFSQQCTQFDRILQCEATIGYSKPPKKIHQIDNSRKYENKCAYTKIVGLDFCVYNISNIGRLFFTRSIEHFFSLPFPAITNELSKEREIARFFYIFSALLIE